MSKFVKGDKVVANKTLVATVEHYDEQTGRLTLKVDLPGGGTDTVYGPIQAWDLELLVSDRQTQAVEDEPLPFEAEDEGPKDEITTLGSLQ